MPTTAYHAHLNPDKELCICSKVVSCQHIFLLLPPLHCSLPCPLYRAPQANTPTCLLPARLPCCHQGCPLSCHQFRVLQLALLTASRLSLPLLAPFSVTHSPCSQPSSPLLPPSAKPYSHCPLSFSNLIFLTCKEQLSFCRCLSFPEPLHLCLHGLLSLSMTVSIYLACLSI